MLDYYLPILSDIFHKTNSNTLKKKKHSWNNAFKEKLVMFAAQYEIIIYVCCCFYLKHKNQMVNSQSNMQLLHLQLFIC